MTARSRIRPWRRAVYARADGNGQYATGVATPAVTLPPGATDASLTPYHVDRGKLFVQERFGGHKLIDVERLKEAIEPTRFPVPIAGEGGDPISYPGLVRAADLIGQLSDPRYLKRIPALFYEFEETGVNQKLGYKNPGDLRQNYPKFYWGSIYPYIKHSLKYLTLTQAGQRLRGRAREPGGRRRGLVTPTPQAVIRTVPGPEAEASAPPTPRC